MIQKREGDGHDRSKQGFQNGVRYSFSPPFKTFAVPTIGPKGGTGQAVFSSAVFASSDQGNLYFTGEPEEGFTSVECHFTVPVHKLRDHSVVPT